MDLRGLVKNKQCACMKGIFECFLPHFFSWIACHGNWNWEIIVKNKLFLNTFHNLGFKQSFCWLAKVPVFLLFHTSKYCKDIIVRALVLLWNVVQCRILYCACNVLLSWTCKVPWQLRIRRKWWVSAVNSCHFLCVWMLIMFYPRRWMNLSSQICQRFSFA